MTIELRSLRVSAELDPSNFVAGTKQIESASKGVSAATKEAASGIASVGAAVTSTETKVSNSANVMEKWRRQLITGYGEVQQISRALKDFSRDIDKNGYDAARVEPLLDGLFKKYGMLGDGAQFAAKGQHEFAAAIANTTSRMQAQQSVAGRAANQNSAFRGAANFNTANIAAQFQDIAVTSAMGMNPLQIALQQGTQLSAVLGGQGAAGAARMLGSALLSVVNPVSLITIGLVAASAAAIQYFSNWSSSSEKTKEELEKQEQLIGRVAAKWGEAAPAIKAYNDELERTKSIGDLIAAQQALVQQQYAGPQAQLPNLAVDVGDIQITLQQLGVGFSKIAEFRTEYAELEEKIKSGTATGQDAVDVQRVLNNGFQSGSSLIKDYADQFGNLASEIDAANASAQKFRMTQEGGVLRGPNGEVSTLSPLNPLDGFNRTPFQTEEEMWLDRQRREEEQRENERLGRLVPIPTPRPNDIERLDMEGGGKKSETTSESFIRSQRERIETLQAELGLVGQIDSVREETLASLRVEQEIRRQGLDIYGEEAKAIRENAALELRLTQQLIEQRKSAAIRDDLGFERSQLFRTPGEQAIASRLRGTGMSLDGPEAQQMRDNQRFAEAKDMVTGFASDFKAALLDNGGDIGDAFAQSILNAASKAMDKAWENIFDQLGNAFASWLTGVQPGAGGGVAAFAETGGGLMGMLGGANDNYAPGAVTRAPLAPVGGAADLASSLLGAKEGSAQVDSFLKAGGVDIKAAQTAWCAGFVNSSLEQIGVDGSGSLLANSFLDWGTGIKASDVMRGDVLVQSRGLGANSRGGHVGFATGNTRMTDGGLQLEMLSGNTGGKGLGTGGVGTDWISAAQLDVRRASEATSKALDQVTTSAIGTGQGLGTLGNGLQQAGSSLMSGAPAAASGGGGGLLGFLGSIFGGMNLAGGGSTLIGNGSTSLVQSLRWANGGAFAGGNVIPFANGDVFDRPSYFPMSGGRTGMMGEAGPEAIMPLRRGADGRLGVAAAGRGGNDNRQREKVELHVHVNGGSGDDHVRKLSQQGAQAALAEYHQSQVQGGFGETQKRFASQKG